MKIYVLRENNVSLSWTPDTSRYNLNGIFNTVLVELMGKTRLLIIAVSDYKIRTR